MMLQEPSTEEDDAENTDVTEDEQYSQLKAMLAKLPSYTEAGKRYFPLSFFFFFGGGGGGVPLPNGIDIISAKAD